MGNVAYARSDINFVEVAGAGHSHSRPIVPGLKTKDPVLDKEFKVECNYCAPILLQEKDAWAAVAHKVPLTPDEREAADAAKETGNALVQQMARYMADGAARAITEAGGTERLVEVSRG